MSSGLRRYAYEKNQEFCGLRMGMPSNDVGGSLSMPIILANCPAIVVRFLLVTLPRLNPPIRVNGQISSSAILFFAGISSLVR